MEAHSIIYHYLSIYHLLPRGRRLGLEAPVLVGLENWGEGVKEEPHSRGGFLGTVTVTRRGLACWLAKRW